jgi:DNA-binding XRE family transcriptional regulator
MAHTHPLCVEGDAVPSEMTAFIFYNLILFSFLEIRLEMGLIQEQFAAKLGVSFPTVNRWENKKTTPSPLAIQKLQKLLSALKKKRSTSLESIKKIEGMIHHNTKKL